MKPTLDGKFPDIIPEETQGHDLMEDFVASTINQSSRFQNYNQDFNQDFGAYFENGTPNDLAIKIFSAKPNPLLPVKSNYLKSTDPFTENDSINKKISQIPFDDHLESRSQRNSPSFAQPELANANQKIEKSLEDSSAHLQTHFEQVQQLPVEITSKADNQTLKEIKVQFPSQSVNALGEFLEKQATQYVETKKTPKSQRDKEITAKRTQYTKNCAKQLLDKFPNYVKNTSKRDVRKVFKDNMSWKKLNLYLKGSLMIENFSTKELNKTFLEFLIMFDVDELNQSDTRDIITKWCHKIIVLQLKKLAVAIKEEMDLNPLQAVELSVTKGWPVVEINYRFTSI